MPTLVKPTGFILSTHLRLGSLPRRAPRAAPRAPRKQAEHRLRRLVRDGRDNSLPGLRVVVLGGGLAGAGLLLL
eukprot:1194651-Prorocentrum_minimum.AAC.1